MSLSRCDGSRPSSLVSDDDSLTVRGRVRGLIPLDDNSPSLRPEIKTTLTSPEMWHHPRCRMRRESGRTTVLAGKAPREPSSSSTASGECEVPVPPRGTGTSLNVQRGKFSNRDNYSKADQPAVFQCSNTWFRVPSRCLGGQFRLLVPHTAVHAIATYFWIFRMGSPIFAPWTITGAKPET